MIQPHAPLVPYSSWVPAEESALKDGSGSGSVARSVLRHNRSVSVKNRHHQTSMQEEVVLVNDDIHRQVMEHQLEDTRRRTEEQSLLLDT